MDENLIGYLLDALDESERLDVEAHLSRHPETRTRLEALRRVLAPLKADAEPPEPPRHLVLATIARVAEEQCRSLPVAPPPSRRSVAPWRGPRRSDLLAAAVLFILVGGLSVPWILQMWYTYGRFACADNMRQFWVAMQNYSGQHEGDYPKVPGSGSQSFAAVFVPKLCEAGLKYHLACDSLASRNEKPATLSELEELWRQPNQEKFQHRARHLAGNYAYSLGYRDNGVLKGPCRSDNPYQPLLADHRPDVTGSDDNSPNHGGYGQNVLYNNGNVRWCTNPYNGPDRDNIYLNRDGKMEAGVDPEDTVLGAGDASPGPRGE
jgi:hypothetical protein